MQAKMSSLKDKLDAQAVAEAKPEEKENTEESADSQKVEVSKEKKKITIK